MGVVQNHLVRPVGLIEMSANYQGGKAFGQFKQRQESALDGINETYLNDDDYKNNEELPDLAERLQTYKQQFMEYDTNNSGQIDLMELKMMMEKMGQAKTHLELKKMIKEVDREDRGAISYNDFVFMMLDAKSSVLKLALRFERLMREPERPQGVAPKRDLASLP